MQVKAPRASRSHGSITRNPPTLVNLNLLTLGTTGRFAKWFSICILTPPDHMLGADSARQISRGIGTSRQKEVHISYPRIILLPVQSVSLLLGVGSERNHEIHIRVEVRFIALMYTANQSRKLRFNRIVNQLLLDRIYFIVFIFMFAAFFIDIYIFFLLKVKISWRNETYINYFREREQLYIILIYKVISQ